MKFQAPAITRGLNIDYRVWAVLAVALMVGVTTPGHAADLGEEGIRLQPSKSTAAVYLEPTAGARDMMRSLEIERGKSVYIKTGYTVKRVSVGNPDILDVVVLSPRELQFVAKATGTTNVLIWDSHGNPQASVDVGIGTPESYLQRELNRILGAPEIKVESSGSATILRGTVPSAIALEQAVNFTRAFIGGEEDTNIVNLLEVGGNQQVMLKVVIAEVSRNTVREMGVNFNALIDAGGGQIALTGMLGGLTSVDGSDVFLSEAVNLATGFASFGSLELLEVFLDILDRRGFTKVLAEPTLVALSGESANFLVGGEIPVPIAQGGAFGSITVEYKKFGVGLSFTPTVLGPDRIHLRVSPEVSRPDFTFGTEIGGTIIPAFNTRRVSTSVVLSRGQTLVIAGLLEEDLREQTAMYPLLGQIPIIGNMFRSSKFEKSETELVILVTPELAQPIGPDRLVLPTDYFIEPSALDFYLFARLEGEGPVPTEPAGLIGDAGYRISPDVKGASDE